jgi:hypothetical protein
VTAAALSLALVRVTRPLASRKPFNFGSNTLTDMPGGITFPQIERTEEKHA